MDPLSLCALLALSAFADVAYCFPPAAHTLPLIVLVPPESRVSLRADGAPYAYDHVLSLDIYAGDRDTAESLRARAVSALSALGLSLAASAWFYDAPSRAYRVHAAFECQTVGETVYR